MTNKNGQIAIYQTEDGQTHLDVRFELDSVWLTQRQMSEVFDTTPENILMHLRNIFRLDAIISVGYRVNSKIF